MKSTSSPTRARWGLLQLVPLLPALSPLLEPFCESAAIHASDDSIRRFRRHLTQERRLDAADESLFDAIPYAERRAMLRVVAADLSRRQQRRRAAADRLARYRARVARHREHMLTRSDQERIARLAHWAVLSLGEEEACWLVEDAFYVRTMSSIDEFCRRKEAIFLDFERRVRMRADQVSHRTMPGHINTSLRALATLGLEYGSDDHAIKQRYRLLAKRHHPDMGGHPDRMAEVNAAYTLLQRKSR